MHHFRWTLLGALLSLSVGCGGKSEETEYAEASPDFEGLSMEVSGAATESATAGLSAEGISFQHQQQGLGATDTPEFLQGVREKISALNIALRDNLKPIATLVNGTQVQLQKGNTAVYGPKDETNATFKLTIHKFLNGSYGWKLEAKPLGGQDSQYVTVMAGVMKRGELAHRGRGVFGLDLDKLKTVAPSTKGKGKLLASYGHTGESKTLAYRLLGFTPDPDKMEKTTAAFVGHRVMPSKVARVRVAGLLNLSSTETAAKELARIRVRYVPGVGGRADMLATGGDIGFNKFWIGAACWSASESEQFKIVKECTRGQRLIDCTTIASTGSILTCAEALRGDVEPPSENANDTSLEPDAPTSDITDTPSEMPTGDEEG